MEPIIEVHNISKHYKQRKSNEVVKAVDNVSFNVYRGEIVGLLGPNGAGKTTTIKTICGLLKPDTGRVLVQGLDNQSQRLKALQHISAVLEGNRNLYWRLTVRENLEYFAGNRGHSRKSVQPEIEKLLAQFHLEPKANELVNNLSRGMQQKLAIAVAMLAGTEVILLDEPTLGLDVETGHEVRELLRQIAKDDHRTIIISTHDMPVVQDLCGRTVIINAGRVVVDDQVSNLLRLFGTRAYLITLRKPLSGRQASLLEQAFPMLSWEHSNDLLHFTVNLEHDEDIYELMDILKLEYTPVESIDRTIINFEQVFLRIVKGENWHVVASSPDGKRPQS